MKESGKLDINSVIDQQEEIEKSWGIDNIREEAWSDPSLDDGSQIEKARKGYPVGTEKTYIGKQYIKTDKGWRLKKKEMTPRERFEKEKSERYSGMDKRSFEIAENIAKDIYARIAEADGFSRQITKYLNHDVEFKEEKNITCSIGISYERNVTSESQITELIKKADDLMYTVKTGEKGHYAFF